MVMEIEKGIQIEYDMIHFVEIVWPLEIRKSFIAKLLLRIGN